MVTIIYIAYMLFVALPIWYSIRLSSVLVFRSDIFTICYWYGVRKNTTDELKLYDKLPSSNKMVFSFKPITLESYFNKDEIEQLLS